MISFGVWSPDEATFWQSWQQAGIVDEDRNFTPEYADHIQITTSWEGIVTDGEGSVIPGWHCNVRVGGVLEQQFTYGLNQTDPETGDLLDIFDRTWAAEVFGLTEQPADETTGFPAGFRNNLGVTYTDARNFTSPSNVWC